ncbi:MAG: dihydrodipicolinate reductase [Candidatus Bathyarchaeia archaeon]
MSIKVIQYGIGEIGSEITRLLTQKEGVEIIGAYDIDENKVGKDLGEVAKLNYKLGIKISSDYNEVFSEKADVVLHSTSSKAKEVYLQLVEIIKRGANVITSSEELGYPYKYNPDIARDLNELAIKHKVAILGTGVNPGFAMDFLPLVLTGVCQHVYEIYVKRIQDAAQRRPAFQRKIGIGLTLEQFEKRIAKGGGHVGLKESITMIADGLGWQLDNVDTKIEPILADVPMVTEFLKIESGQVIGLKQKGEGFVASRPVITLDFVASLIPPDPHDEIQIIGKPSINLRIDQGLHGDLATSAIMVNAIPRIIEAEPGFKTMKDIPAPFYTTIFFRCRGANRQDLDQPEGG